MALPPGFVLEEPPSGGQQPTDVSLPPGFQLEQPGGIVQPPPEGGFIPALQRGALQTGSLIFDVLPGMAARLVGADEYAEKQFREAAETERKIQERYAPAVPSYKDIKGLGTGLTYLVESVGELIPSILPSLFTGGAAAVVGRGAIIAAKEAAEKAAQKEIAERGVQALTQKEVADQIRNAGIDAATKTAIKYQGIGAIGGSSLQNIPEVFQNIKEETGEESIGTALAFGGFNSILDAALPLSLMIKARKAGIPSNELAAEWYKRFGKSALKGFATEGATEAAQEMSSAAAEKFVDNNIDFFSERNFERFINAGLKGGLGGGVVSGATDVVLGRKPLTEADKPLDEDIRNTQSDILARRALLDELRAQAAEEGRNRLDPEALKDLGFGTKYSLYNSLLNKDINDPVQAQEVLSLLQAAIDAPETKGRERVVAANTLDVVNQYLSSVGDLDVGQVITEPVGAGISVPATPVEPTVTEGVGGVERTGVAPVVPDVGAPVVGEEVAPAPVTPTAAAPVQPIAEPAPVEAAAPADVLPTTQQLIAEQEAAIASQMEKFQNLLKQQIDRFGLKDVAVRVVDDMQNANAQYTKGLIKLAVDAADPVRDLRHESVHALKELGFFSPAQWQALVRRANESWINTYLQNRDIDGNFIEPGKESRYDAYIKLFKQQGLDEAQIQEALVEEAISDAFGDFSLTKAPPGMMQAILNRMKKFFRAIKETVTGSGVVDPEEIFGKIEKAEIAAPAKPKSEVAAPAEKKTAPVETPAPAAAPEVEEPAKLSIAAPRRAAPENQTIDSVSRKFPLSKQMFDSTSLGMQTGKSGKEQFEKQKIGGISEIISFLERRRRESGVKVLNIDNEVDRITLANLMTAEALASIDAGGAALEWYDETIAKTIGMAALKYPDLATDLDQQMAFKLATAIASQGMNVEDNLRFAMRQYDYFTRNGRFEEIGTGTDAKAMKANYELANLMFDKYKLEKTRRFLSTPFTVEELRSAGFEIGGELGEEMVLGSSIFGPKIGFGFYSNLNGNFEPVTMDMWFMRLIGRLTGKLRLLDERLLGEQLTRFRETFNEVGDDGVYANDFTDEQLNKARANDEDAIELARVVNSVFNSEFSKANLRELYDEGVRKKTAFVNAAQRILNSVDNPKDAPQNGTERQQLRDVVRRTVENVEKVIGKRIPPASLQALVWYPEQELYASLGAKLRVTSQDYAGAMKGLLEGEGYGRTDLDRAAENGARAVRGLAVKPVRKENVPVGREPRAAFGQEEREGFLEERRTERVVEQEREKPRRHKVVFEVAPDPTDAGLVGEWRKLDTKTRLEISNRVSAKILPRILEVIEAKGRAASQVGSYLEDTNPSFALYVDKGNPVEISKYLGYVLGQDSMMIISPRPAPGLQMVGAVVVDINSQDPAVVDRVYQQLRQIRVNGEQPVGGQSTINGKMVVLNYSNLSTDALASAIKNQLKGAYDVGITDVYSAFPEKDSYDYSDPQADPRGKAGALRQAARALRREATKLLAEEIGYKPAKAREEKPVTPTAVPKYSISGKRITDTPELREAAKKSAIVDKDGNLIPMYHGTGALIRIFRPKQAGATFVSPSPDFASGFTSTSRLWMVRHIGQFLKPDEIKKAVQELRQTVYSQYGKQSKTTQKFMDEIYEVLKEAKETGFYNFEGELEDSWYQIAFDMIPDAKERVMELYVLAKNPFDFEKKDDVNKVIKKMLLDPEVKKQYGYEIAPKGVDIFKPENFMLRQTLERNNKDYKAAVEAKFKDGLSRGRWTAIETPEVQRAIRGLDFDSFYVFEGGVKNLGVYDPKLIKSADENFGPFGQRPPSEEEARAADMTPEEALQAQMEGDIRFSLRAPQTPEFKRWFGDSKVVDENGEPMVVYHGTNKTDSLAEERDQAISQFDSYVNWFTTDPYQASGYATQDGRQIEGASIYPVYLSLQNPLRLRGDLNDKTTYAEFRKETGLDVRPGPYEDEIVDGVEQEIPRWWITNSPSFAETAFNAGFDGVIANEGKTPTFGVFYQNPGKIKSATGNIGTFDPTNPDIRFSLRSPIGLYSELENKIEGVSAKAAPAPQWKAMINGKAQKGIKPEEIEWSGVNDWLDLQQGRVTKEDLLNYLRQNGVQVEETVLGEREDGEPARFGSADLVLPGGENYREVLLRLPSGIIGADAARLKELTVLIDEKTAGYGALSEDERRAVRAEIKPLREERDAIEERRKRYKSTHWNQPNVLAHIRVNDRTDADGNKVLFVEEIQSDWGQEGKKKGFNNQSSAINEELRRAGWTLEQIGPEDWVITDRDGDVVAEGETANAALARAGATARNVPSVPAAPFVTKTEGWLNLALKRIMVMAAEGGYDKVAFVNGEQSADRYDLSKRVNRVRVHRDQYDESAFGPWIIEAEDSRGNNFLDKEIGSLDEVEDYIGKEVAQRLIEKLGNGNDASLSGLDLKVGGKGMKTFYDQIVPLAIKKLLPKVGGGQMGIMKIGRSEPIAIVKKKIENNAIQYMADQISADEFLFNAGLERVLDEEQLNDALGSTFPSKYSDRRRLAQSFSETFAEKAERKKELTQPGFDVTPAMREKVETTGLPKFSLRSKPFDRDSLPTNNKEYTLPQNTILYHGAYKTVSDAIESVGYLASRPKIKAHGGLMNEGGLVWFGSKETAQKYANSEADPGKVKFDRELGIIREPGKVFEAVTDQPYKLISRYKVLSAKEANALNEALGLPDYKRLTAGDDADTAAYRAAVYSNSNAERFEIKSGKYTETVSAPWPIILKTLNADGFYSDGTVALTAENGIRLSEEGKPMERFSLRSALDPAINARILQTTTERDEASFPQRITDAIGPQSRSRFRAAALNRYNRLGELDKEKMAKMGGAELLADSNAESAALLSDLAAGIVAGALGVYDGVGGVPVYKHHFVVERQIMGPRGPQFVVVGGKIQSRQAAEALARRYPNSKVKERGFTAVSNLNNTVEGPLKIFTDLAKMGDPYAYRAYQYWAGVKRGSKWMTVTQGPQKGQVVEELFELPDIQKAEKLRQEFKQKYKIDFEKIQKEWIKYNDELVQYALDTGVISKENAKKFKDHGDYIPFYRQINGEDDAVGPRIFQSISAVQAPRKIKGGEDPLGDFLENVVRNTQSIVQAGLKNVAARRAADQGMDLGFVNQISQSQASPVNSFYVLEDGKKVYYDTSDVLLIDSIKSLGMPEIPLIGLLAGPANTLRNLVTKDPGFMLANMMRDSLAAWTTSGVNMMPIAATLKNFTEALANTSPEYKALLMGGVVGGYDYSQGTKDAAKQFGKELRKAAGAKTLGEKALTPFTSVWDALEKGTQASDAATRIEVYKQTLKDTGNEAEALFRALEVMNFNRKGNNPIVRVATAAIPFLNARMQGLDVLYRAGLGKNATANAKEIQKAFWRRGMYMAALSTMYWMLTHDDEEYKKQEQETKDNNWLFPSLGIKIPIPFEIGVLFKVIPERIAALTLGDDTAKDFTKSMVRNLANTLAFNPIPQTFVPIVEAVTNYDFFTMRPIVGQGLEGVAPEYQIGPRTSRLGETLGKAIGVSPMKVDQIIQGYTGTLGQYMSDLIDSVYDLHTENPKASKRFEQMPVFKRFMIDPDARGQVTAYFDLKNAVDEATRTANLLERSMDFKEWGKYYSENIGLFAVKDYVLDMDKTLTEYREMKNMIRSLPMDADAKRDNIRAITQIENMMVSNIQLLKANMVK